MRRRIISISLREDLITRVDNLVDGTVIRNRSHALESILVNYFREEKIKVLILAGSQGKDLLPLTKDTPKCMLDVGGKPILEHVVRNLRVLGFTQMIISVSYKADKVMDYFGDGSQFGVEITYIQDPEPLGTAGALIRADKFIDGRFILIYGDNFFKFDLTDMVEFHEKASALGTVGLTTVPDPASYGVVELKGSKVVDYSEKPTEFRSFIINGGIYIFEREIFSSLDASQRSLERDVLPRLAKEGKLAGYNLAGQWIGIDTKEDLERARKLFSEKKVETI
tara:strand:+ start:412 stop:1254 length:843 start_codon:yes stop_codon:yes gene_type:complete